MKTQFGNRILESDICVLCAERPATTKEHIPPKSLFIERPKNYLSVPACVECNNSTKLDDEYLQQVMAGGSLVGEGIKVWKKKVAPKFKDFPKTKLGLRKQLSISPVKINSNETFNAPVMMIDHERIEKSIKKMVYGLYWFHTGKLLIQNARLNTNMLNPATSPNYFKDPENIAFFNQTAFGVYQDPTVRKSFFYTMAISEDLALCYFFFYKQSVFITSVHVPQDGKTLSREVA